MQSLQNFDNTSKIEVQTWSQYAGKLLFQKISKLGRTQPSAQSPLLKLIFGNNCQKYTKADRPIKFYVFSLDFFLLFSNILSTVVYGKKLLPIICPSILQTSRS